MADSPSAWPSLTGHSILAAFNLLTILFLGFVQHEDYDYEDSGKGPGSTPHHAHVPASPSPAGAHPMKPMTSRASSLRASSPPASEASYPAIPGR